MALTRKQKAFVQAYLATFNATEAARRAKYNGDDATLASVGWENLRKPEIAKAVQERLAAQVMSADEVLNRLSDHARADIKDFLAVSANGDVALDIQAAEGKTHLIKKVTQRHSTRTTKDSVTEDTVITLELHDAQAALVHIGKHHKLFVEQHEVTVTDLLINVDK